MSSSFAVEVQDWMKGLQDSICSELETLDGVGRFKEDNWQRTEGGGGRTRVLDDPKAGIFEKAGVNFSSVHGQTPAFLKNEILQMRPNSAAYGLDQFLATGVSLVLHPLSPRIPIVHMNVRYFRIHDDIQWFGGGIDLTPIYIVPEDARYFHAGLESVCNRHDKTYYPKFKAWADDYFYLPHRGETRGVGGIFFDRLLPDADKTISQLFDFVKDVGRLFVPLYSEIVGRHRERAFGEPEKQWQQIRRARYAEFNLVYDRGTRFGLETGGRTESILMSLPPTASWHYNVQVSNGSAEYETLQLLKKGIDWTEGSRQ